MLWLASEQRAGVRDARKIRSELGKQMGKMRTLLRKIPTGLYFQGPDRWTSNPAEALNFKSIDRALKFIETWRLKDVELAFGFKGSRSVTAVPLEKTSAGFTQD